MFNLSQKFKKTDGLTVCFFGDGATNQGVYHETLNLASIWKLPILFVLENNGYGMGFGIYPYSGSNLTTDRAAYNAWSSWTTSNKTPDVTSTWYTTNDATLEFTGFQLEVGDQATPFKHRSLGEELALCQRYYEGVFMTDGTACFPSYASYGGSTNFEYQFKVNKRTTPTWSLVGDAYWAGATPNAYESHSAAVFQHNGGTLFALGDGSGDLCGSFSAEL